MSGARVRVIGPAILLLFSSACASTVPRAFQPKDTAGVQSLLRNGDATGAISGDSVFALAQVEPVSIVGYPYARLWLLVRNDSSKPILVEPMECASLHIESNGSKYGHPLDLTPSSPTSILAKITNEEAEYSILGRIGAVLSGDGWHESFKSSVNQGVLRRNTLLPGEGVNGYVYFKVPSAQPQPSEGRYVVTLTLPEGEKVAMFERGK
jgi:hypothetical protein